MRQTHYYLLLHFKVRKIFRDIRRGFLAYGRRRRDSLLENVPCSVIDIMEDALIALHLNTLQSLLSGYLI